MALSAITDEDTAIDRELERIARETPPVITEGAGENIVKNVIEKPELLSDLIEGYKPAATVAELENQMFQVKTMGAQATEATEDVIRFYCGKDYKEPYFMFKGIAVYRSGTFDSTKKAEAIPMEAKIFGEKKIG